MKIETQLPQTGGVFGQKTEAEQTLQDVFAEVLAEVGKQGYASAEALDTDAPLDESISQGWETWFQTTGQTRYQDLAKPANELRQDFGDLLLQAHRDGGYSAPQAFIKSLSQDQLATLQHINRLVEPLQPDQLTEEGALNLLLPPPAQVDFNNDGLTQSGIGYSIRFPDSRTPADVAEAWYEATADLDPGERAFRQLQMKADVLLANIHLDADGRFLYQVEPGDPRWVNPMASPDYSYLEQTEARIASIEYFQNQTPPEQYARDLAFWTKFQAELIEQGVG